MSFNIDDQGFLGLNVPFDSKLCNYFVDGEDGDIGSFIIESIPQYLERVSYEYRTPQNTITIILPKQGFYPESKCLNNTVTINTLLSSYESKNYAFVGGLKNINFIEIYDKYINVVLIGLVNGINKIFKTPTNYKSGEIIVFLNGIKERHFLETGNDEITLEESPKNNGFTDLVEALYLKK